MVSSSVHGGTTRPYLEAVVWSVGRGRVVLFVFAAVVFVVVGGGVASGYKWLLLVEWWWC